MIYRSKKVLKSAKMTSSQFERQIITSFFFHSSRVEAAAAALFHFLFLSFRLVNTCLQRRERTHHHRHPVIGATVLEVVAVLVVNRDMELDIQESSVNRLNTHWLDWESIEFPFHGTIHYLESKLNPNPIPELLPRDSLEHFELLLNKSLPLVLLLLKSRLQELLQQELWLELHAFHLILNSIRELDSNNRHLDARNSHRLEQRRPVRRLLLQILHQDLRHKSQRLVPLLVVLDLLLAVLHPEFKEQQVDPDNVVHSRHPHEEKDADPVHSPIGPENEVENGKIEVRVDEVVEAVAHPVLVDSSKMCCVILSSSIRM